MLEINSYICAIAIVNVLHITLLSKQVSRKLHCFKAFPSIGRLYFFY